MNKIHKLIWNTRIHGYVVVSEAASSRSRAPAELKAVAVAAGLAGLLASSPSWAVPVCAGPQATTISSNQSSTVVASCNQETITVNSGVTIDVSGGTGVTNDDSGLYWDQATVVNNGTISGMDPVVLTGTTGTQLAGFTNTGTIESYNPIPGNFGGDAVKIGGLTVTGTINNNGTITAGYSGFHLDTSTVPLLLNSGSISGTVAGVSVYDSDVTEIRNEAGGTIHGNNTAGIYVRGSDAVVGLIKNSGTISSSNAAIQVDRSGTITRIENLQGASITGNDVGIELYANIGDIDNAGTISGGDAGIFVRTGTLSGTIVNQASGVIHGGGSGLAMGDYDTYGRIHSIINEGLIEGGNYGIDGYEGSSLTNGIDNRGTIKGGDTGILLRGDDFVGNATITGGITNSGTIEGGIYAIRVIDNNALDRLDIVGTQSSLKGDVDASLTDVNVKSDARFSTTNAFRVRSFTVETGAEFTLTNALHTSGGLSTNGITVSNGFVNNGTVLVGSGTSGLITGTYTQSASGTYSVGVDSVATHGVLAVSGDASLASGSKVNVAVGSGASFNAGDRVQGVLTSGGTLTATGLTLTDSSVMYKFTADTSRAANELDLLVAQDEAPFSNNVGTGRTPLGGVAANLDQIVSAGVPADLQPVFDKLTSLPADELPAAMAQLVPVMTGAGSQAGVNALRSMNKMIQSRMESNQGLSSGNEASERFMWVRTFGSEGDQDSQDVVAGFRSKTWGIVVGGDKPVSDRVRAGLAFTYARTDIDSRGSGAPSSLDVNTYELVHYGSYNLDPLTDINYQLDVGYNEVKGVRQILFMGQQARSDFNSLNLHASLGIGRTWVVSPQSSVTPSVRVDYTHMKTDGYTETGAGPLNLQVDDSTFKELMLTADLKGSHNLSEHTKLVGNVSAGYDFLDKNSVTTSAFVGGGAVFETRGLDSSPWLYRAGLGLLHDSSNMEYSLRYDLERRTSGYTNQTLSARVRWAF
ncbi:MAG: autotransporter domain-containing protein [Pseudomonadota bacterium]